MDATLTIQVRVIGAQAAAQLAALQKEVAGVSAAGTGAAAGAAGGGAFAGVTGLASRATAVVGKFGSAIASLPAKLGAVAQSVGMAGRQMTFGFTLPVVGAGTAMTKWALDNERAMTQVRKVYGDFSFSTARVKEETDKLAVTFRLLSDVYGVNQSEVISLGAAWAQVGLTGTSLAMATKATMEAMVLGNLTSEEATNSIITLASAYKLSFKDMGNGFSEVTDAMATLNAIENQTGASFSDLVAGIERSASSARDAGVDIKDLASLVASLAPATGSGAAAGNAIKSMLSRIITPTKQANELLTEMKINISGEEWQNAPAIRKIEMMAESFNTLDQAAKNQISSVVAGRWQINRFSEIMSDIIDKNGMWRKAQDASSDSTRRQATYTKELKTQLESTPKRFEILSNMIKNNLAQVMINLLPVILKVMAVIERLTEDFNNLAPSTQKTIIKIIALVAVMGPVLMMTAALIRAVQGIVGVIVGFGKAIGWVLGAIWTLIKGLAQLVIWIVRASVWLVKMAIEYLPRMAAAVWDAIVAVYRFIAALAEAAFELALQFGKVVLAAVQWLVQLAIEFALNAIVIGYTFVQAVAMAAASMIDQMIPAILLLIEKLYAAILAVAAYVVELMIAVAAMVVDWVAAVYAGAGALLSEFIPALFAAMGAIGTFLVSLGTMAVDLLLVAGFAAYDFVAGISAAATAMIAEGVPAISAWVTAILGAIWELGIFVANLVFSGAVMAVDFVADVFAAIGALAVFVAEAVTGAAIAAANWTLGMMIMAADTLVAMWGVIVPAVTSAMVAVVAAVYAAAAAIGIPLWALVAVVIAVAAIIAFVLLMIFNEDFRNAVIDSLQGIIDSFGSFIDFMSMVGWGLAQPFLDLNQAITDLGGNITDILQSCLDGVVGFANFFIQILVGLAKAIYWVVQKIVDALSYLDPFARHSPSLVDNVRAGVGVILDEYAKLAHIPNLVRKAADAQKAFADATKGARDTEENRKISVDRQIVTAQAPQATGAFDSMTQARKVLEASLVPLTQEIDKQKQVVASLQSAWDKLDKNLKKHTDTLKILEDEYQKVGDAISAAKDKINELLNTPLTGQTALEDEIYNNQLAVARLKLQLMQLEDAGGAIGSVTDAFNNLQQAIDDLQGVRDNLYLQGAGSDVLDTYDAQLKALRAQQKAIGGASNSIDELKNKIDQLQRAGDELDLKKQLTFDDQQHQLEQMAKTVKEMSFGDIAAQIATQKQIIMSLQPIYDDLGAKVAAEKDTVTALTDERDRLGSILDDEKSKLDDLESAYSDIKSLIESMNSDMRDFVQGLRDAKQAADDLAAAQAGGLNAGDFPVPTGSGLDTSSIDTSGLDDLNKKLGDLKKIGDPFKTIKDWLKRFQDFFSTVWSGIQTGWDAVIGFFEDLPSTIGGAISGAYTFLNELGWTVIDSIVGGFTKGMSNLWEVVTGIGGSIISGIWTGITAAASWLWGQITDYVSQHIIQPFKDFLGIDSPATAMVPIGGAIIEGLWQGILGMAGWLMTQLGNIPGWIWQAVKEAPSWLISTGAAVLRGLWNGIVSASGWLIGQVRTIGGWVVSAVSGAVTWLVDAGRAVIVGLWNGIVSLKDWLIGWVKSIPGWITGAFYAIGGALNTLYNTGRDIVTGLWNGIVSMGSNFIEKVKQWIIDHLPLPMRIALEALSPSRLMARIGHDVVDGLTGGIYDKSDEAIKAAQVLAEGVKTAMDMDPIQVTTFDIQGDVSGLPTPDELNALRSSVFQMTGNVIGSSATEAMQSVTNQYNSMEQAQPWAKDKEKAIGYQGTAAMGQPSVIVQTPDVSKTVTLTGDLVFPNITSPDDAQLLIDNLKSMVDD